MALADYLTVEWAPSSTPFEDPATWVDITNDVQSLRSRAGAAGVEDVFAAGECTLEVVNETPTQAQWIDPNVWYRMRQLRVMSGSTLVFHGWVKSIEHDVNGYRHSAATIRCIDIIGLLSNAAADGDFETWWGTAPEDDPAFGRIINGRRGYVDTSALADVLGWLGDASSVYWSSSINLPQLRMFIPADLSGQALSVAQPYLEAQRATLVRATSSPLTFTELNRYQPFGLAAGSATATLTDVPGGYGYLYGSLRLSAPDEAYYDQAVVGGQGIAPQRASDVPAGWPATGYTRAADSPLADANWAAANAAMIVAIGKQTDTYPRQLTVHVAGPTATSVDASHPGVVCVIPGADRLDVVYDSTTYKCRTVSIEHDISVEQGWRTTFGLSSLDRLDNAYTSTSIFTLGTSALGGTDILGP